MLHFKETLVNTRIACIYKGLSFLVSLKKCLRRNKNANKITSMQHEMQHEKQVAALDIQCRPFLIS